jgi:hypothetical protein
MLGRSYPAPGRDSMRRTPALLAAVTLVVALSACSGADDPSPEELQADITEELQDVDPDLTDDQAECVAEQVIAAVGEDEVNDIDFSAEDPGDLEEEFAAAAVAARDDCLGEGTTTTAGIEVTTTTTAAPQ